MSVIDELLARENMEERRAREEASRHRKSKTLSIVHRNGIVVTKKPRQTKLIQDIPDFKALRFLFEEEPKKYRFKLYTLPNYAYLLGRSPNRIDSY